MKTATIQWNTRDLGYGSECGIAKAVITDEIDTWGKRTILIQEGDVYVPFYLFSDEYNVINEATKNGG